MALIVVVITIMIDHLFSVLPQDKLRYCSDWECGTEGGCAESGGAKGCEEINLLYSI